MPLNKRENKKRERKRAGRENEFQRRFCGRRSADGHKYIFTCFICIVLAFAALAPVRGEASGFSGSPDDFTQNAKNSEICLPVIMYHSVLKNRRNRYIVSPEQLENDLIAIKKEGYETVFPSEVISYVKGKGDLPDKPIIITFDDGHYNNYHYALPLFQKYGVKGVINIVGTYTEFTVENGDISNPNYSHLTWEQIEELSRSGHFEIGNHSYNMHKYKPRFGVSQIKGECDEDYCREFKKDISGLQTLFKEKSHIEPKVFAYPFGKFNKNSEKILKELGFEMTFTCACGVNLLERGNIDCLARLKRYNREGNWNSKKLISTINKGCTKLIKKK